MPLTPPPSAPPAAPSAPGDAPSRANPTTFRALADAFVVWLVSFRTSLADLRDWIAGYLTWAGTHITELEALQADVTSQAGTATTQAGIATTKAGEASTSAAAAAVSEANSLSYLQAYRATSYGALADDPTEDPNGNPPTVGDEYFNTTAGLIKRFNGATWQASDISTANLAAPTGLALVGFIQSGTGAVARTAQDKAREIVSFWDHLSIAERADALLSTPLMDHTASMQKAIDAAPEGATILGRPGATFAFTSLLSTKALTIDFGGANLIVSPGVASLAAGTPAIKFDGAVGAEYAINSVTSYGSDVVCTTAGDAANFTAGDWVIVADEKEMRGWDQDIGGTTSRSYAGRNEINRVESVSAGTITLAKPVEHLYDTTPTVQRITSPIYQPRILNVGTITEVDPGGAYTGSFGITDLPHIFSFVHCIQPYVGGIKEVNGWQLHVAQFTRCAMPTAEHFNCINPFRPDIGGHGYVVQFERCSDGLATRIEGHGTRHTVDFTQSYDCVSMLNVGYDPRSVQFYCHGQASRRCKSVDDAVYTNKNTLTGPGWQCGNPAFNADFDYTVVRPVFVGAGGTGPFVAATNSERTTVIEPTVKLTATSTVRAFDINSGAKDTRLLGGTIDLSGCSSSAGNTCLMTRDITDAADLVGVKPDGLTVDGVRLIGPAGSAGASMMNLTLATGEVRVRNNTLVGSSASVNGLRVAADCALTKLVSEDNRFEGSFDRGQRIQMAPSVVYQIKNNDYSSATFATASEVLTASSLLDMTPAPGVVEPGDASITAVAGSTPETIIFTVPMASTRTVTLNTTTRVWPGAKYRVIRAASATGPNPVNVGTGPLKALSAGQWCEVVYDGSAWALTAFGSL